jgi:hypothetical protein
MTRRPDPEAIEIEPLASEQAPPERAKGGEPPPSPRRSRAPLVLLGLVLLLGAGEAVALVLQHLGAASEADWRAAAEALRGERKREEPVLFAPAWVEPIGREVTAADVELEQHLLSDVDRHPRVWELSVRGARHPWLRGLTPARARSFGAVSLALYEKRAEEVLYDFTRRVLADARVERIGDRMIRCWREGKRIACDKAQRWNWVGPHLAEVGHRPYRCIYAHAVDGHLMRITFPKVPIGRALVGYTGIDDFENRKRSQRPVRLEVRAGDQILGSIRHENDWPWRRFSFDTAALAGKSVEVRFEVAGEGAFARTFCFSAEVRR